LAAHSLFLTQSSQDLHRCAESFFDGSECLLLAPARGVGQDFLRTSNRPGFLGVHVLTLPQLAAVLATPGDATKAPLSHLGREALTARVVHAMRADQRLAYFNPVADLPGFSRALARTILELRLENVDLRELAATGESGRDLSLLAREYAAELSAAKLTDLAILYQNAIEVVRRGSHSLTGLPMVLLDAPVRFALEKRLVKELADRSPRALAVCLESDTRTAEALKKCFTTIPAREIDSGGSTIARVRRSLFSAQPEPIAVSDATLTSFSAPGEALESAEIARRILALSAAGTRFDQIAVLLRSPERYQPLLEEAFRRAGIPGYFSGGTARPDPAGRAFLALLRCAAERCSASRFAEYLSLAQTPELTKEGAPHRRDAAWTPPQDEILAGLYPQSGPQAEALPDDTPPIVAPVAWERLLVDAAVVGGRERWARRLRGLAAEFRLQLTRLPEEDEAARQILERRLERLGALEQFALPLVEQLAALPHQAAWGEWLDRLQNLAEIALRRPESVASVLEELRPMDAVGPVSLDEVEAVLQDRLRFLRRDQPSTRYGCVFVSSPEEARGRFFEVTFLPGLAEGIFPQRASEDPLLLDLYRARIAAGLLRQDDRVAQERLLLHIAVASCAHLEFSYPRVDVGQSRPRVPSFYALEILRAAEGRLPDLHEFERRAAASSQTRLGWPAPADPDKAIDDAEFDLAILDQVSSLPRNARPGAARYLVECSPVLARSLRTRWRRWHRAWSAADGLVDPDPATLALLPRFGLKERTYSPTSLQQYAACPYRFFLHAVHRLRPREDAVPLEQLDPLTRGALFHSVQQALLEELRSLDLLPLQMGRLASVLTVADQVLNRVAAKYEEELAPAIPRVWSTEIEDMRMDLRGWLRHASSHAPDWMPIRTELGFGIGDAQPEVAVANGFRLRGAVDLIEQRGGELRVTDHKTGKPAEGMLAYVGGGKVLQPVLYGLAVESLTGLPVSRGRLYYCTNRGGYREIEIPLTEAARDHAARVLLAIDAAVASGFLPAAPEPKACETCDYRPVCGPFEELRAGRKPKSRLQSLIELRRMG
jgi:ATP-dependent helicase/nuclease subunit B